MGGWGGHQGQSKITGNSENEESRADRTDRSHLSCYFRFLCTLIKFRLPDEINSDELTK